MSGIQTHPLAHGSPAEKKLAKLLREAGWQVTAGSRAFTSKGVAFVSVGSQDCEVIMHALGETYVAVSATSLRSGRSFALQDRPTGLTIHAFRQFVQDHQVHKPLPQR